MKHEPAAVSGRRRPSVKAVDGLILLPSSAVVQTREGGLPAEHLMPGDELIARGQGYVRLSHVSRLRQQVRTVWVKDGFLPDMAPTGGVLLPAHQPVLRRDVRHEMALPAQALASLGLAEEIGLRQLTLIQLWLSAVDTIYAAGLEISAIPVADRDRRVA